MNTTLIFAELLVIGFQVMIWFVLLVIDIFNIDRFIGLQPVNIKGWEALVIIVILIIAYTIGVIFDRLVDRILEEWEKRIRTNLFNEINISLEFVPIKAIIFSLEKENPNLASQLEYTRSRIRVARASIFNFALITIFLAIFIGSQIPFTIPNERIEFVIFTLITGAIAVILALYSWIKLDQTYYQNARDLYKNHFTK